MIEQLTSPESNLSAAGLCPVGNSRVAGLLVQAHEANYRGPSVLANPSVVRRAVAIATAGGVLVGIRSREREPREDSGGAVPDSEGEDLCQLVRVVRRGVIQNTAAAARLHVEINSQQVIAFAVTASTYTLSVVVEDEGIGRARREPA